MRRGQVALEFLTTYGWAIMVLLVVIGALAYFGTFNPQRYIPDRCEVQAEFSCEDFVLTKWENDGTSASEVSIILVNSLGKTVDVPGQMRIRYEDQVGDTSCGNWIKQGGSRQNNLPDWGPGEKVQVVCNTGPWASIQFPADGEKAKILFSFNYTLPGSSIPHPVQGEIVATVQPQA